MVFATPANAQVMLADLHVPLQYAAPEIVQAVKSSQPTIEATAALDAWQLGLLGYEMMVGKPLFAADMPASIVLSVMSGDAPLPWEAGEVRCVLHAVQVP
jgi:hypothetical protein